MPDLAAHQGELSRRLQIALLTPALLLLLLGATLANQIVRMSEDASWVEHSDEVLAQARKAQVEVLNQETGLRGYLLTQKPQHLEPYLSARPAEALDRLRALVHDNNAQVARVDEARRRYDGWLALSSPIAALPPGDALRAMSTFENVDTRRRGMDNVRVQIDQFISAEEDLRHARAVVSAASTQSAKLSFVALLLGAAAAMAFLSRRQLTAIASTYGGALEGERAARRASDDEAWLRAGQMKLADEVQGDLTVEQVGTRALQALVEHTGADLGAFFTTDPGVGWKRRAGVGLDEDSPKTFATGEGLVGRAAQSDQVTHVRELPAGYLKARSGTGEHDVIELLLVPCANGEQTSAVVELGFLRAIPKRTVELMARIGDATAVAVQSAEYRMRLLQLLEESQQQAEELQAQQEELRVANEELEEQGNALRVANAQIAERQEELEATNARLEEQAESLAIVQRAVAEKAAEAERQSRYKSEFLANMSHELRTPLNSSLILAKLLSDNKHGNLSAEQVRFAETIYSAGNDLLALINDILDLSKIEAGQLDVRPAEVRLGALCDSLRRTFEPMALDKKLVFECVVDPATGPALITDPQRLDQILRNLISNAIKFTDTGSVSVRIEGDARLVRFAVRDTGIGISTDQHQLVFEAFKQVDGGSSRKYGGTGLGLSISRDLAHLLGGELALQSEPGRGSTFTLTLPRQGPPVTSAARAPSLARPAPSAAIPLTGTLSGPQGQAAPAPLASGAPASGPGGAGSAASAAGGAAGAVGGMSPAAASLLAGAAASVGVTAPASMSSHVLGTIRERAGSPARIGWGAPERAGAPGGADEVAPAVTAPAFADDRGTLDPRKPVALIVEDDPSFARIVLDLAREQGFQGVVAHDAASALALIGEVRPNGIILDINLPDTSGLSVLDRLKRHPSTRHIPVHMMSVADYAETALAMGAIGYMLKPARREELIDVFQRLEERLEKRVRRVLIVEDDATQRESLHQLLGGDEVETVAVATVAEALKRLHAESFDCVVTDLALPDASGFDLLERMAGDESCAFPPVIVYTGRSLDAASEHRLRKYSSSIIVKGARSPERLLDEVTLFLHQVESELPPERQRMLRAARDREAAFEGRTILVVEDDVRNIFALSSVLEPRGARVLIARNGREALDVLGQGEAIDLVLMDLMMPEMDGLQATREIRKNPRWARLPIIALTAKAMKDDQERCRDAGFNDYIAKPLDVQVLLSLLRVWMPR